jgi:hypothetical protein
MFKTAEEMQKFGKARFEATNSGLNEIAKEAASYSSKSIELAQGAFQKMAEIKSFDKVLEIQAQFAKMAFENFSAQTIRMVDLFANLSKDAFNAIGSKEASIETIHPIATPPVKFKAA